MNILRRAALPAVLGLAACATAGDATKAERQELANMSPRAMTPASSPATLVGSFNRYCAATPDDAGERSALLRDAGYVPAGGWERGLRSFVVSDARPKVVLSESGRMCAVRALARSGQAHLIEREIAARYPAAQAITPPRGYGQAWETVPGREMIAVLREARGPYQNEITVALLRR